MNFLTLQTTAHAVISAHATFAAVAADVVFIDLGFAKPLQEKALEEFGYSVSVWPPIKGSATDEGAGVAAVDSQIVVRIEADPQAIKEQGTAASAWFNNLMVSVVEALLAVAPEAGGVKWQLSPDAFELVNFDEGLVAYHIRFQRLAIW